jgi:FtsH-binding integral membrane protein
VRAEGLAYNPPNADRSEGAGMATATATQAGSKPKTAAGLPGRRYDHVFFSGGALLMLLTVLAGFARTYFLAGMFKAPLPSLIIHIHGAAFTTWIVLLVAQTSLVFAGRVDIHRRLGVAGFLLGGLMVVLGVLAATDALARGGVPGRDPRTFYIVPMTDMLIFATLLPFAFRARFDPPAHKRLIYVATMGLLTAAIARLPMAFTYRKAPVAALLSYSFLLLLMAYDLWSTRKVHRATLRAGGFVILLQQLRIPIATTGPWLAFAAWVQSLVR